MLAAVLMSRQHELDFGKIFTMTQRYNTALSLVKPKHTTLLSLMMMLDRLSNGLNLSVMCFGNIATNVFGLGEVAD
jgi:hypothetical protein